MLKLQKNEKHMRKELKCLILRILFSTMRTQERPCIRRILHAYSERILRTHKLKNRYTHGRIDLRTHESRLCNQEQVYACRLDSMPTRTNTEGCSSIFFKFSNPKLNKHVPTPPRVSGFHLNPFQSKTQAFTSLKMD